MINGVIKLTNENKVRKVNGGVVKYPIIPSNILSFKLTKSIL